MSTAHFVRVGKYIINISAICDITLIDPRPENGLDDNLVHVGLMNGSVIVLGGNDATLFLAYVTSADREHRRDPEWEDKWTWRAVTDGR